MVTRWRSESKAHRQAFAHHLAPMLVATVLRPARGGNSRSPRDGFDQVLDTIQFGGVVCVEKPEVGHGRQGSPPKSAREPNRVRSTPSPFARAGQPGSPRRWRAGKVKTVTDNSSFMITHLIDGLQEVLPNTEGPQLEEFTKLAAEVGSDPSAEWQRAFRCAKWAEAMVSLPAHRHLIREAERSLEAVRLVEGTAATTLGQYVPSPWHVSNEFAVEITWVYEALHVAEKVAAAIGWEKVPWSQLLSDLISVRSGEHPAS